MIADPPPLFAVCDDAPPPGPPVALDGASLTAAVAHAWLQRQAATQGAQALASTLLKADAPSLASLPLDATLRLQLVLAEAAWLQGDLNGAQAQAQGIADAIASWPDSPAASALRADAWLLRAVVAHDRGDTEAREVAFAESSRHGAAAGDDIRRLLPLLQRAIDDVFLIGKEAAERWQEAIEAARAHGSPVLMAPLLQFEATLAYQTDDLAGALGFGAAADLARTCGQQRRELICRTNLAHALAEAADLDGALDALHVATAASERTGWPALHGLCLMQTGHVLMSSGRASAALAVLRDAVRVMQPVAWSRNFTIGLDYLGQAELKAGTNEAALAVFSELQQKAAMLGSREFEAIALQGQSRALHGLCRTDEAVAAAEASLHLARQIHVAPLARSALEALTSMAIDEAERHPDDGALSAHALAQWQRLHDAPERSDSDAISADLLERVAAFNARLQCWEDAYRLGQWSSRQRTKAHDGATARRVNALEVRHATTRARAEAEHQRQLALTEAQRADALRQDQDTLAQLARMGREIAAHLDVGSIATTLLQHARALVDCQCLQLFTMPPEAAGLVAVFSAGPRSDTGGTAIATDVVDLRILPPPSERALRCARLREELIEPLEACVAAPGVPAPGMALCLPMQVHGRLVGVLEVHSAAPQAYSERARQVVRTLSAYAAIALDHASAVAHLQQALAELAQARDALREQALTDPLTGLRNRHFLLEVLPNELRLCERQHAQAAGRADASAADLIFFLVDIDHFKRINDVHGHPGGDRVLAQMRARLEPVFRATDHLARWGGEEFLVVARQTRRAEAPALATRLCEAVSAQPFLLDDGSPLRVTCSVGWAAFPVVPHADMDDPAALVIQLADHALYMAKKAGRNRWRGLAAGPAAHGAAQLDLSMTEIDAAVQRGVLAAFEPTVVAA